MLRFAPVVGMSTSTLDIRDQCRQAARAARNLLLFRDVVDDPIGRAHIAVIDALAKDDREQARTHFSELFYQLAKTVELGEASPGDALQQHLLDRILLDDNPFSQKCEQAGPAAVGPALHEAARQDLTALHQLFALSGGIISNAISKQIVQTTLNPHAPSIDASTLPALRELAPLRLAAAATDSNIRRCFEQTVDWSMLVEQLADLFNSRGAGQLARYRAFRWIGSNPRDDHPLQPVVDIDPIRLTDLIGYDVEREIVIKNTEYFLAGQVANNVLLYGDRGTGKSSTVKALLNEYSERGLRLVEVPKSHLSELSSLLTLLRGRRERFIIFVDDLSFDDNETHYRDLKAILEGGIEARPANVLLYATSNRRHIVSERFSDRGRPGDEIHAFDTVQEKLSFSDRFGISVTFSAPDQDRYLQIVDGLAAARNLPISHANLHRRALEWETWQNGRSARTARQFIDFLTGEFHQSG